MSCSTGHKRGIGRKIRAANRELLPEDETTQARSETTINDDLVASGAAFDHLELHPTKSTSVGSLAVRFDDRVLRPRPWTVEQAHWAVEAATVPGPVADLCAGAGHIGLVLACLVSRDCVLVDADPHACFYARSNAAMLPQRVDVDVRNASISNALMPDERFAIITADPPWVPSHETMRYPEDPRPAIDGGPDGLDLARLCVDVIGLHLAPGGIAILQVGTPRQADLVDAYAQTQQAGAEVVDIRIPSGNGTLIKLRHPYDG